jgi:hypothetical protein
MAVLPRNASDRKEKKTRFIFKYSIYLKTILIKLFIGLQNQRPKKSGK